MRVRRRRFCSLRPLQQLAPSDGSVEIITKASAAVIPTALDELERGTGSPNVLLGGVSEQRAQIVPILGSVPIVPRKNLQRYQMSTDRHVQREVLENGDGLGLGNDLVFDSGRSE